MKQLRPYQDAAIKSLFNWLFTPDTGNPLIVAPVGAGKSLMIAEFVKQVHALYPRTRIVMITHVKELLEQNAKALREQYPDVDMGFYCAGLGMKRLHNDVTFASIQSIADKAMSFNRCPEIIIIDECHLISHKDTTQYRRFIDEIQKINPACKVIGFTGTPFRSDTGRIDEGEGALFDGIAYEIEMSYMIEEGYWAKPVSPALATKMDVSGVSVRGGDYVIGELEKRINTAEINDACVMELITHGANRRKWLVFTASVQHCKDVCAAINAAGISAEMITGDTPKEERAAIIERFRRGEFRCLVNVAVLTTGFDVPDIDLLAFMRPTRSPVLYIQTTGRGVRPVYADGYDLSTRQGRLDAIANSIKPDCMILDFGGVVAALGPIDCVSIRKKYNPKEEPKEKAAPITKICPHCAAVCMAAQRYCYNCSYCFIELSSAAAENAIVSSDEPPEWINVLGMHTSKHVKKNAPDAPPTLCVTYTTLRGAMKEWICYEHGGYARDKARKWHFDRIDYADRTKNFNLPKTIDEALLLTYPVPKRIQVKRDGKFWRIMDYDFVDESAFEPQKSHEITMNDDFEIPF